MRARHFGLSAIALGVVLPSVLVLTSSVSNAPLVRGALAGTRSLQTASNGRTSPAGDRRGTGTTPIATDPFLSAAFTSYMSTRTNLVTAAVYDVTSGATYLFHPGVHEVTASMVKIEILADLLYRAQLAHRSLTPQELMTASAMIEYSDNKDATTLWNADGQLPGISAFNQLIGERQTQVSWSWGEVSTTPLDELALLKTIALPNSILDPASRTLEQSLMQGVIPEERFGLGVGPPSSATIGLKDGYYDEPGTGWQLNSAGYVHLGDRFYLATIMTAHNPTEAYGIDTLNAISTIIWHQLQP